MNISTKTYNAVISLVLCIDIIYFYFAPSYLMAFTIGWIVAFLFNSVLIIPIYKEAAETALKALKDIYSELQSMGLDNLPKEENGLVDINNVVKKV